MAAATYLCQDGLSAFPISIDGTFQAGGSYIAHGPGMFPGGGQFSGGAVGDNPTLQSLVVDNAATFKGATTAQASLRVQGVLAAPATFTVQPHLVAAGPAITVSDAAGIVLDGTGLTGSTVVTAKSGITVPGATVSIAGVGGNNAVLFVQPSSAAAGAALQVDVTGVKLSSLGGTDAAGVSVNKMHVTGAALGTVALNIDVGDVNLTAGNLNVSGGGLTVPNGVTTLHGAAISNLQLTGVSANPGANGIVSLGGVTTAGGAFTAADGFISGWINNQQIKIPYANGP